LEKTFCLHLTGLSLDQQIWQKVGLSTNFKSLSYSNFWL